MRLRVVAGAGWLVLWQACTTKKKRRQTPPSTKPRTDCRARRSHESEMRSSRVLHGYAICHPSFRARMGLFDDSAERSNIKSTEEERGSRTPSLASTQKQRAREITRWCGLLPSHRQ